MKKLLELEALRGASALYVFLHHTLESLNIREAHPLINKIFLFGQEAVMIFFLLSGYVIALSISRSNKSFKDYMKSRFFRIYPIVAVASLIAFLALWLTNKPIDTTFFNFLGNIFMLQDLSHFKPGIFCDPLFNNAPLWSLSYEWWFYILGFGYIYVYNKHFKDNLFLFNMSALIFSLFALITFKIYPNKISLTAFYYYIWFSGVFLFFLIQKNQLNMKNILLIFSSYLSLIFVYFLLFIYNEKLSTFGFHPLSELRHYGTAAFLLMSAILFYKKVYTKVKDYSFYIYLVKLFSMLAPISFAMYVIHYPINSCFVELFINTGMNVYLLLIIEILVVFGLSYLIEIKLMRLKLFKRE